MNTKGYVYLFKHSLSGNEVLHFRYGNDDFLAHTYAFMKVRADAGESRAMYSLKYQDLEKSLINEVNPSSIGLVGLFHSIVLQEWVYKLKDGTLFRKDDFNSLFGGDVLRYWFKLANDGKIVLVYSAASDELLGGVVTVKEE